MRFWDRIFIWVLGLALFMSISAVAYPERTNEIREVFPLWLAQLFATIILSYPLYAIGRWITDWYSDKQSSQRNKSDEVKE